MGAVCVGVSVPMLYKQGGYVCVGVSAAMLYMQAGCVCVGIYVAMLYKQGGLCTCWGICSDVVHARRVVYVLVYL